MRCQRWRQVISLLSPMAEPPPAASQRPQSGACVDIGPPISLTAIKLRIMSMCSRHASCRFYTSTTCTQWVPGRAPIPVLALNLMAVTISLRLCRRSPTNDQTSSSSSWSCACADPTVSLRLTAAVAFFKPLGQYLPPHAEDPFDPAQAW